MKREEVKAIFPDATDEQVDNILNKVGEGLNPLKASLDDASAKRDQYATDLATAQANVASLTQQLEEANKKVNEGMSAEELLAQREKAAADKEREFLIKSNSLDARTLFVDANCFDAEDIDKLVKQVTTEDAKATKAFAQQIIDATKKVVENAQATLKDELLKTNPKNEGGQGGGTPTTKKEFMALPYEQQLEMKANDPTILTRLK